MADQGEPTVHLSTAPRMDKPRVRVFLSFAKRDAQVAERLWELLGEATRADRAYHFDLWRFDEAILVGEDWDTRTREALAVSDLGLLAVSNAFLGSKYITGVEVPALVDVPGKRVIPVSVRQTSRHADWHGLDSKQVYSHQRPFAEVRGRSAQDGWVNELVDQIHRVLTRYSAPTAGGR